ncbi:hypothetical protein DL93DRAFT_2101096 [Clavulina sp. PMI_390]|nr:hypothetical protein DL93DRAFT_2101096 [Clavulina sp. PMI_390]
MSQGSNAANRAANAVSGAVKTVHGAGEAIRGNINSFADTAGERAVNSDPANPSPSTNTAPTTSTGLHNASVAKRGEAEVMQGMSQLQGGSVSDTTATRTTTAAPPTQSAQAGLKTNTATTGTGAPPPMTTRGQA